MKGYHSIREGPQTSDIADIAGELIARVGGAAV